MGWRCTNYVARTFEPPGALTSRRSGIAASTHNFAISYSPPHILRFLILFESNPFKKDQKPGKWMYCQAWLRIDKLMSRFDEFLYTISLEFMICINSIGARPPEIAMDWRGHPLPLPNFWYFSICQSFLWYLPPIIIEAPLNKLKSKFHALKIVKSWIVFGSS